MTLFFLPSGSEAEGWLVQAWGGGGCARSERRQWARNTAVQIGLAVTPIRLLAFAGASLQFQRCFQFGTRTTSLHCRCCRRRRVSSRNKRNGRTYGAYAAQRQNKKNERRAFARGEAAAAASLLSICKRTHGGADFTGSICLFFFK